MRKHFFILMHTYWLYFMGVFISWQKWLKPGGELLITDYCRGSNELSEAMKVYVAKRHYHLLTPADYGKVRGFPMALFTLRKFFLVLLKFFQQEAISSANNFFTNQKMSSIDTKLQSCLQVDLESCNFLFIFRVFANAKLSFLSLCEQGRKQEWY